MKLHQLPLGDWNAKQFSIVHNIVHHTNHIRYLYLILEKKLTPLRVLGFVVVVMLLSYNMTSGQWCKGYSNICRSILTF